MVPLKIRCSYQLITTLLGSSASCLSSDSATPSSLDAWRRTSLLLHGEPDVPTRPADTPASAPGLSFLLLLQQQVARLSVRPSVRPSGAAQFRDHARSRACPLGSGPRIHTSPLCLSFSHFQKQKKQNPSSSPPHILPPHLSLSLRQARFLERVGSASSHDFCTSHLLLCPASVWLPPPSLLKQLSIARKEGNICLVPRSGFLPLASLTHSPAFGFSFLLR